MYNTHKITDHVTYWSIFQVRGIEKSLNIVRFFIVEAIAKKVQLLGYEPSL